MTLVTAGLIEKLSETEINLIEHEKDYSYRCSSCKAANVSQQRLVLPSLNYPSENTVPKTLTESILSDEASTDCVLCCEPLNDDEISCEKCGSICHSQCMSAHSSDICQACVATDDILLQQSQRQSPVQTPNTTQRHVDNDPPVQYTQSDENDKTLSNISQRESALSEKMKELRQLEAKVRKKENELKLKETKIKEYEKNNGKMEAKIEMLEYRNKELVKTITNLQDRLDTLDTAHVQTSTGNVNKHTDSGNSQPSFNSKSRYDDLIQGIHDRVSAYVLLKVEKQIETLIDLESDITAVPNLNSETQNMKPTANHNMTNTDTYCHNSVDTSVQTNEIESQTLHCTSNQSDKVELTQAVQIESDYTNSSCTYTQTQNQQVYNPQHINGQSLFYGNVPKLNNKEKSKKRFLRHSNLIKLVN